MSRRLEEDEFGFSQANSICTAIISFFKIFSFPSVEFNFHDNCANQQNLYIMHAEQSVIFSLLVQVAGLEP
jgi:hypothetical protein